MGQAEFEASRANGIHAQLQRMTGTWEGPFRIWFEPGKLADESIQRGTLRSLLGGRVLLHEYTGTCSGQPFEGVAMIGHHLDEQRYECAWAESFGTGTSIMYSTGTPGDPRFAVLGSYGDGQGGPRWGWRTEIEQPDDDHLTIRMFNITPAGEEALGVETCYRRVAAGER